MKPKIKQKWVEALRSGEYKQTQHKLRGDDGFCCLGVLCDLYAKEVGVEWTKSVGSDNLVYYSVEHHSLGLPGSIIEWAGLESPDPVVVVGHPDNRQALSELNDDLNASFEQIATFIEEQV